MDTIFLRGMGQSVQKHMVTKGNLLSTLVTGRNEVLAKVIFLHLSVILFTGGGLARRPLPPAGWRNPPPRLDGEPPPRLDGGSPPSGWRTPPGWRPPGMENPPWDGELLLDGEPPREADSGIQSTIGRYASYWNAFLFQLLLRVQHSNCSLSFHFCFGCIKFISKLIIQLFFEAMLLRNFFKKIHFCLFYNKE